MTHAKRSAFRMRQGAANDVIAADADKALKLDRDNWLAWNIKGILLSEAGERDSAAAAHRRVVELRPNEGQLRWRLAQALKALGRMDEAVQEAHLSLRSDPEFLAEKYVELHKRGYLLASLSEADDWALRDAAAACMIDEACR